MTVVPNRFVAGFAVQSSAWLCIRLAWFAYACMCIRIESRLFLFSAQNHWLEL